MHLDQKILNKLNEIGIALSHERHIPALLEKILIYAKDLTSADGGAIYTVTPAKKLHFAIAVSDSMQFHVGGTSKLPIPFSDLPLFLDDGSPNDSLMVAYAVNHKKTINIKDAYHEHGFDFSGTRRFDERTGYRTKSVLTVPMKNHEDEVIAVLQLINPIAHRPFSEEDQQLAESLASQAGVALTNQYLIESLRGLFESLIRVIAEAIDEKSPSTANHGKRVPVVALLLAQAVSSMEDGPFKDVKFSEEELYELEVAAFLHDCGKITTPVHVVEKQSKLETIFDRIHLVNLRYDVLAESNEKELFQKKLQLFQTFYPKEFESIQKEFAPLEKEHHEKLEAYQRDQTFIARCNEGKAIMTLEMLQRLRDIEQMAYLPGRPLLTPDELENLSVVKGNLTQKEREIIEHHVVMTYRMLTQLNFPKELKCVPEIAASHHERVDGKGYPRGLKKEQMSIQARILAIADIFEALAAPDRPYKEALPLSQVFDIMGKMVDDGHLDPDLFDVFIKKKAYLSYARQYLASEQIDI
jgi:HD-GYP domain-containing protein (c-di-GMP phosphodiesterase class II)